MKKYLKTSCQDLECIFKPNGLPNTAAKPFKLSALNTKYKHLALLATKAQQILNRDLDWNVRIFRNQSTMNKELKHYQTFVRNIIQQQAPSKLGQYDKLVRDSYSSKSPIKSKSRSRSKSKSRSRSKSKSRRKSKSKGRKIYKGPRGGKYYKSKGRKVYI